MYDEDDDYDYYFSNSRRGAWEDAFEPPQYWSEDDLWELAHELLDELARYNNDLAVEDVFQALKEEDDGYIDSAYELQLRATGCLVEKGLVPSESEDPS
jgi:hypothetical protein